MRSACWASWELSPVNHAKVNKQTIKNKLVESVEGISYPCIAWGYHSGA